MLELVLLAALEDAPHAVHDEHLHGLGGLVNHDMGEALPFIDERRLHGMMIVNPQEHGRCRLLSPSPVELQIVLPHFGMHGIIAGVQAGRDRDVRFQAEPRRHGVGPVSQRGDILVRMRLAHLARDAVDEGKPIVAHLAAAEEPGLERSPLLQQRGARLAVAEIHVVVRNDGKVVAQCLPPLGQPALAVEVVTRHLRHLVDQLGVGVTKL